MNHLRACIDLCQQLRGFDTMLLGPVFKIHIVKQTAQAPKVHVLSVFGGEPAHDALHRQGVLNVERLLVVFFQQGQRLLPGQFHIISS